VVIQVGDGTATVSETIQVVVNEVNVTPVLAAVGNKSVNEGAPLSFTATATDGDVPVQALTFSLGAGAPAGASITSGGIFTWTPTEAQGPSTNSVAIQVSDGTATASETIEIVVNEVNTAPVLAAIGNQGVNEDTLLTFTATATDADLPAQTLTFSLGAGAPAGASITSGGVFTWTPTETQGPSTNSVVVQVSDGTTTVSETIQIIVTEGNSVPVLAAIGGKTVNEGALLSFTATATDADQPDQTLTFSLGAGAPAGASITSEGVFTWTPTEAEGPTTNIVVVMVTDGTVTDSESVEIIVNELNLAPVLEVVGNRTVNEKEMLTFTASATDSDLPSQTLTFSLGAGAPAGASITTAGVFTWTPTEAQGPNSYSVTIEVSDGTATDSEAIQIVVNELVAIAQQPQSQTVEVGSDATFTVGTTGAGPLQYQWRFNGADLAGATQSSLVVASVQYTNAGSYEVVVTGPVNTVTSTAAILTVSQSFAGLGLDGYVAQATVFFDADFDGERGASEPSSQTDDSGRFNLEVNLTTYDTNHNGKLDPEEGRLVLSGGLDIATGLPLRTPLTAPAGSTVVSPLTTLMQAVLEQTPGMDVASAEETVKDALGITNPEPIVHYDALAGALANDPGAVEVLAAAAAVQDTLVQVVTLVTAGSSDPEEVAASAASVMDVLAAQVQNSGALDLSQANQVTAVIEESLAAAGTQLDTNVTEGAAAIISQLNQLKDEAVETAASGGDAAALLTQVQGVAQGKASQSLGDAATGNQSIDDVVVGYTGSALEQTVTNATVGDLVGTDTRPGSFSLGSATFRANEDGTQAPGMEITISRADGNQGAVTVRISWSDGTAKASVGDYQAGAVDVTFADGEISKPVSLAGVLNDDSLVEGEETMGLTLSLAPGAPAGVSLGAITTATLAVTDNDFPGTFSFSAGQYRVNENGVAEVPVRVVRSGGSSGTVTLVVTPATVAGGAMAGLDFLGAPFEVRFEPGNQNRMVSVPVIADNLLEGDEAFELAISLDASAPPGAAIGTISKATVTIENNGARPPQARIESFAKVAAEQYRLRVSGTAGQKFLLETSSNLQTWTSAQTGTLGSAAQDLTVNISGQAPGFYRLRLVP
jgi:hypothetical protein